MINAETPSNAFASQASWSPLSGIALAEPNVIRAFIGFVQSIITVASVRASKTHIVSSLVGVAAALLVQWFVSSEPHVMSGAAFRWWCYVLGGQKKQWIYDIVQWGERSLVEMVRQAENRKGYRCFVHEAVYARTSGTASWWWCPRCRRGQSECTDDRCCRPLPRHDRSVRSDASDCAAIRTQTTVLLCTHPAPQLHH